MTDEYPIVIPAIDNEQPVSLDQLAIAISKLDRLPRPRRNDRVHSHRQCTAGG